MRRCAAIVVLAVALVGVAPLALAAPLTALPGFSVELPSGKIVRDERDYPRGTVVLVDSDDHAVIVVSWQPSDGEPMSAGELETMARILANGIGPIPKGGTAVPTSIAGRGGKPLQGVRLGDGMWSTLSPCAARDLIITTIASRGAQALHRRVLGSIACTPDAAQEAALRNYASTLLLDLPKWSILTRSPVMLQLTDQKAVVMLQRVPGNIENELLAPIITPILQHDGTTIGFDPPRDGRVGFSSKESGQTLVGWARIFHCPASSELMMVFTDEPAVAQSLWTRIGHARCLKPGEAAQSWPASAKQ